MLGAVLVCTDSHRVSFRKRLKCSFGWLKWVTACPGLPSPPILPPPSIVEQLTRERRNKRLAFLLSSWEEKLEQALPALSGYEAMWP